MVNFHPSGQSVDRGACRRIHACPSQTTHALRPERHRPTQWAQTCGSPREELGMYVLRASASHRGGRSQRRSRHWEDKLAHEVCNIAESREERTYRITTGECPVAVVASPFDSRMSCSRSMNSRRRGCFCGSARSHPAELRKHTLGTPAFFVAVMSSCVMSN